MKLFDVYPLFNINLSKGKGSFVWDENGVQYLDFYGGHAVISIGHSHPYYIQRLEEQLYQLAYYSNSVHISQQQEFADKLGRLSQCNTYNLFLCNSGAEAIENALKLASFYTKRKKIIAFKGAFHGRTSGAVAITDNPSIKAIVNDDSHVVFLELNNKLALNEAFLQEEIAAVVIEPIQGINGIYEAEIEFLQEIQRLCNQHNVLFIADEIQCGYGRTGKFFAHQWANVEPDIITMAKGMGNGFPIAGILIHPKIEAKYGMLGTTFGGSPLACAAGIAVLDVIEKDNLLENTMAVGHFLIEECKKISAIKTIRGKGLIIGLEFDFPIKALREKLVYEHHIFVGNSNNANTLRLLPNLMISKEEAMIFIEALKQCLV